MHGLCKNLVTSVYGRAAKYIQKMEATQQRIFFISSKSLGNSVSRTPVVTVERCIDLFVTDATVCITVANANVDADDACSDVDAYV